LRNIELDIRPFKLSEIFLESYKTKTPNFGFNGLGEFVFYRTYSRIQEDGGKEEWWQVCQRVIEWVFTKQKEWINHYNLGWSNTKAQKTAKEMYDRMFEFKWLPPGRGLWAAGTAITEERKLYAALNNCSFVSTQNLREDLSKPFEFLMDMSMLGVGVGFDVLGAGQINIKNPNKNNTEIFKIEDSREGWVSSLQMLLDSYFLDKNKVEFDYSLIREAGSLIKGFGGVSSGYKPLQDMHESIRKILNSSIDKEISETNIVDIMNIIGVAVVAGNLRRTAEIAFGSSNEFINLKNYDKNPERQQWGWASNNSIIGEIGQDYSEIASRIAKDAEPGIFWLSNAQKYSRMGEETWADHKALGGNPCLEQTLESYELCCLVSTFPTKHEDLDDYKKTLKYAYMYAKTVTLCETHWPDTNKVMLRNRRIGTSIGGIAEFLDSRGIDTLRKWVDEGYEIIQHYDEVYSDWFAVPKSIKTTSVKPDGSVSLLAGVSPGIHFPESRFYIRRVRLSKNSNYVELLKNAGYNIELAEYQEDTFVVEFPVKFETEVRSVRDVSMWEQLELASFLQEHWADNQISCTITFNKQEASQIEHALDMYQYKLKGVSMLPLLENGAYAQMPYEKISEKEFEKMSKPLKKIDWKNGVVLEDAEQEKYCTNDSCTI